MPNAKFMQSIGLNVYQELQGIADSKNISIQELIRAVIIPEWLRANRERPVMKREAANQRLRYGEPLETLTAPATVRQAVRPAQQ